MLARLFELPAFILDFVEQAHVARCALRSVIECLAAVVAHRETRLPVLRRTTAAGSGAATSRSANHLIGAEDKRLRKTDTERICCLEI